MMADNQRVRERIAKITKIKKLPKLPKFKLQNSDSPYNSVYFGALRGLNDPLNVDMNVDNEALSVFKRTNQRTPN